VTKNGPSVPAPLGLLAELTHRCPLGCPYCSNPLVLDKRNDELDTATWARVFGEAAALGVLQVHLSGGEPAARRDLPDIVKAAREAGLYSNLITSAVGLTQQTLAALAAAGLDHVQISIQDNDEASADHIAGYKGAFARKRALAREVVRLGLPLTINMVVHRANIGRIEAMVDLSLSLGAGRVLPCHAAEVIPGLEFWNVREHSLADIWRASPAFLAFRDTNWMREPCQSCPRRELDFGGCRCQAFLLTGDARATDPVCHLSPQHAIVAQAAAERAEKAYEYRRS
jgi:radical SAM protein with 4Fe4S-binding SPASM domain